MSERVLGEPDDERFPCRVSGCPQTTNCSDRICFEHAQRAALWARDQKLTADQVWDHKCPAILQPVFVDRWLEQLSPAAAAPA